MKRKIFTTVGLLACFMVCLVVVADINGTWSSVFNAPDGNQYPVSYTFKVDGSKLTGTLEASGMTAPIDSGVVKNDSVKFSVTVQGNTYSHKGKYYAAGDSIGMDVSFEGGKGHMTMKRAQ